MKKEVDLKETVQIPGKGKLQINLFGTLAVCINGLPLRPLRSVKGYHLLALLALRHGKEASRHWLAETLWPDSLETQARNSLRQSLADLRHALGTYAHLLTSPQTMLRLNLIDAAVDVDLITFDAGIRRGDFAALKQAVAVYTGPLLEGINAPWVLLEREERHLSYVKALETLAHGAHVEGDWAAEVAYLRLAVSVDPMCETATQALMQTLAQCGEMQSALDVYLELRQRLHAVGAQPAPATSALYNSLRQKRQSDTLKSKQVRLVADLQSKSGPQREPEPQSAIAISAVRLSERRVSECTTGNMPLPLSSLIGRENELKAIEVSLLSHRLVTLVGPGGVGKTRLAIQVANDLAEDFAEGVWFLDLSIFDALSRFAPVSLTAGAVDCTVRPVETGMQRGGTTTATGVTDATERIVQELMTLLKIAEYKGRTRLETIVETLGNRRLLIVLDNCEGMVDACCLVVRTLLSACPHVSILATSRQRLGLNSEIVMPVTPLTLPDEKDSSLTTLHASPAVRLFLERAQAVRPSFALDASNVDAIREICRRLDGLPLALELAAALADMLTPAALAQRLQHRLALLDERDRVRSFRHQTLRAVIAASADLLTKEERVLLRRLSLFTGGSTIQAAEAVCSGNVAGSLDSESLHSGSLHPDSGSPFMWLRSLVSKSLVVAEERNGQMRYRLLEGIREYAREKLEQADEVEIFSALHLNYYTELALQGEQKLTGPQQTVWLEKLETETGNLWAGLAWAEEQSAQRMCGLQLAAALGRYWQIRGHFAEGCRTLHRLLAMPETQEAGVIRANALNWAGLLSVFQGNLAEAQEYCQEGYALWVQLQEEAGAAGALGIQGIVAANRGDLEAARRLYGQALERARAAGDPVCIAGTLGYLGIVAATQGYYGEALACYEESLAIRQQQSDHWGIAASLNNLGQLARRMGEHDKARELLTQTLALRRELGDRRNIGITLNVLAHLAWQQKDLPEATACYTEALALFARLGDRRSIAYGLEMGARLAATDGQATRAAHFCGAAQRLREEIGAPLSPAEQQELDQDLRMAATQIESEVFMSAREEGRLLKIETLL